MTEQKHDLEGLDLISFFGVNEKNLNFLRILFPHLVLVQRNCSLIVRGGKEEIQEFETFFQDLVCRYHSEGTLDENIIMQTKNGEIVPQKDNDDVLVYAYGGTKIRARTANQRKMVEQIEKNDMLFALGPAGSGKTYTAVALAVRALKSKQVKRIVLTRPAVEAGENLGFLPGDMREKLDPYLQPLYDALRDMLSSQRLERLIEDRTIEIAPLAFMRGRTLDNAFVILDEAQNSTATQLKMFLTRMGRNSKFIITGDSTQVDLPKNQTSGLIPTVEKLKHIKEISIVNLTCSDIVRHSLVTKIVEALD
ncbi:MAG: PhoH family protein [Bacteroidales bacterium]|nr:PhoH family protein [Bacteroidales bacterium]